MAKKKLGLDPVDLHVGHRIRARRNILGMSQQDLGDALQLTYQQIQKYENGMNRVVASRLFQLSRILKVTIPYFFDGLNTANTQKNYGPGFGDSTTQAPFLGPKESSPDEDVMEKRETYELVRAYYQIQDPGLRSQILEMAKAMAKSQATK